MYEKKQSCQTSFKSNFNLNKFAYNFHIKDLLQMFIFAKGFLNNTNNLLEQYFGKVNLPTLSLTMDQFLNNVWWSESRQVNKILLYSVYNDPSYPIKVGIDKRNGFIKCFNTWIKILSRKLKEDDFDQIMYYSTEEDLLLNLIKVFSNSLLKCKISRKVIVFFILGMQRNLESNYYIQK